MAAAMVDIDVVRALFAFLERYPRWLLLTGAGVSTASGIPDYRDPDGVRRGQAPVQGPEFRRMEAVRKRYWARSMAGWPVLARAQPNPAHLAIAELEAQQRLVGLVTQNVDGLHRRAGSVNLVELHGNIHSVVCLDCGAYFARELIQSLLQENNPDLNASLQSNASFAVVRPAPDGDAHLEPDRLADFRVPHCLRCAGTLQPDVVFFGDGVPRPRTEAAETLLQQADALLVAGSSLMVYSSYRLCRLAAEAGTPIAAINLGKTRADPLLSFKAEIRTEHALPLLAGRLAAR